MGVLVYKDLAIQKKNLWALIFYPVFLHLVLYSLSDVGAYAAVVAGVVYIFALGACVQDDQNRSEILLSSLPISRKDLVLAKYLTGFCFLLIGMGISILIGTIMHLLGFARGLVNLEIVIGMFFAGISFAVFFYPVYFKFGYIKSRYYALIVFLAAFLIPVAILETVRQGFLGTGLQTILNEFNPSDGFMSVMIVLLSIFLLALSIVISIKAYQKREFF